MKIMIVEDEASFSDALSFLLKQEGYEVVIASDGREALAKFAETKPDFVLLDVMIPEISGTEVCRTIRATSDVPIIMVTAKDAEIDRVVGLELGADDYVTKPFSLEELVARLRALLRRIGAVDAPVDDEKIRFADLELDEATHEVRRAGQLIDLSPTEFTLLRYLMINADRVVSKSQILDHVWQYDFRGDAGIVETYVSYLRKKIDTFEPALIHTVRGVGYRMRIAPTK